MLNGARWGGGASSARTGPFADAEVEATLRREGTVLVPYRLPPRIVADLADLHRTVAAEVGNDASGRFMPTMVIQRPDLRARLWDGVRTLIEPEVHHLFRPGTTEVMEGRSSPSQGHRTACDVLIRTPSIFDETRHVSLSLWIPLSDSRAR